ncbi:hypothetical protein M2451_002802 [Dysgonomonas sp. PFB1-18]|uniref:S24 family peptidase n=1 Tax=unclassified Dysgonomonas TaxID=2630389 RepID=UPI0024757F5D|nr:MULTISPECIES: LexA family transcriptional regulator [unclassified Dysgonomonas]MDH6309312.1 hypothetical protein [Dysgonomonas sp. PF1-14]MDH6339823.1 hypothetical protein [Dysgonomonas sp. PF1-16]MDH6381471.1 hypothetical protein [Dysgonomonas sp. PFB1-18]MDH6398686.1 hypothetical protein [Dysgonomonas sp. PF1-23]
MDKKLTQKDRILEFLESLAISKNKFYTQTGIANGTLDKKSGITGDTIVKIHNAYPDLSLEWLITGEGEMLKSSSFNIYSDLGSIRDQYAAVANVDPATINDDRLIRMESPLEFIPIFTYKELHHCEGYLSIPKLNTCDGSGYVKTDSMYPLIKPGDIVCYKTANNTKHIHWGEMYILYVIIDGEEYLTIKNLERSQLGDDYVCLTGQNPKYHPKDIPAANIQWKALIKAHVSYNSIM